MNSIWLYIFVMALTTYLIRVLPMVLIRKPIKNAFINNFLYYVPYVTLSVMTFPAIIEATNSPIAGAISLLIGIFASYKKASLISVAVICCVVVFIVEIIVL